MGDLLMVLVGSFIGTCLVLIAGAILVWWYIT